MGWTALMHAISEGHLELTALLLEMGIDVDAMGTGDVTALMLAPHGGHTVVVAKLLASLANPRKMDALG